MHLFSRRRFHQISVAIHSSLFHFFQELTLALIIRRHRHSEPLCQVGFWYIFFHVGNVVVDRFRNRINNLSSTERQQKVLNLISWNVFYITNKSLTLLFKPSLLGYLFIEQNSLLGYLFIEQNAVHQI